MSDISPQDVVIAQAWFTPASWALLEAAIAAAGMPQTILADSYEDFISAFDCFARGFEEQGIRVEKLPINVPHMVEWCSRWGLEINSAGRARYGAAPLRK